MKHPIEWRTAAPLWDGALGDETNKRLKQPAILRFASDTFIEDLQKLLQTDAAKLRDFVIRHEQWDNEDVGWISDEAAIPATSLKLYQPFHGRFYFVAASLVCRIPGLPDRVVDTANEEKVSFVLRRRVKDANQPGGFVEYGWLTGDEALLFSMALRLKSELNAGPDLSQSLRQEFLGRKLLIPQQATILVEQEDKKWLIKDRNGKRLFTVQKENGTLDVYGVRKGWMPTSAATELLLGEERLPLSPMNFQEKDKRRRLLIGLVPVGSSETYQASPKLSPLAISNDALQSDPALKDPRLAEFQASVVEGLINLREALEKVPRRIELAEARGVLLFICLDFAQFLQTHLPAVWTAVNAGSWNGPADAQKQPLFNLLRDAVFFGATSWGAALTQTLARETSILSGVAEEDANERTVSFVTDRLPDVPAVRSAITQLETAARSLTSSGLDGLVGTALGEYEKPQGEPDRVESPKIDLGVGDDYVIRCVYERPKCKGIFPPLVSKEASQPFQLASFFDPEAPARQLNITMPIDTSISGLRKFPKKVSFLISKKLRQQMDRIQGVKLTDLDSGDINGENPSINLGMICSLSIPIITICALILLLIMVQLLNIVFWWLPFFKICFPSK